MNTWLGRFVSEDGKKRDYYLIYTLLFLILVLFCYSYFIFSGTSLIWRLDGWTQYFRALAYYSQYLRDIVSNLIFAHKLILPKWDFYISEGGDILNTLHYYVAGDPLALFSAFFPIKFLHYYYSLFTVLRMYLAGITFSALCFGTGKTNRLAVLMGALSYAFCFWAIYNSVRHPYFMNPLIYFPLIILGIEKIIRKERSYLLAVTVFLSAACSFYFFYMMAILAGIYFVCRSILLYKNDIKSLAASLLKTLMQALIGIFMAGLIFLPVISDVIQDIRMSSMHQPFHLLYPFSYYSTLPGLATSFSQKITTYWLRMGYTPVVILALFYLFIQRRKNKLLKVLFFTGAAIVLLPIGGRILNGLSYMTNRWSWAFALLCSFILVTMWESWSAYGISIREEMMLTVCSIGYYLLCLFLDKSRCIEALSTIPLFFLSILILKGDIIGEKRRLLKQLCLVGIGLVGIINVAFWYFSTVAGSRVVTECLSDKEVADKWNVNETGLLKALTDQPYIRYTGRDIDGNVNLNSRISNTQYYWTLSNPYTGDFRNSLQLINGRNYVYEDYDDRTTLNELSSIRYYVSKNDNDRGMPYGYELIFEKDLSDRLRSGYFESLKDELGVSTLTEEQTARIDNDSSEKNVKYAIYENKYTLPLGYCYDKYIPTDKWNTLDPVQKQETQLDAVHVNITPGELPEYDEEVAEYTIPFEISCNDIDVSQNDTGFVSTDSNTSIEIKFNDTREASETYIGFEGLSFTETPEYDLYFGKDEVDPLKLYNKTNWEMLSWDKKQSIKKDKLNGIVANEISISVMGENGVEKHISYFPSDAPFSSGKNDFIVNLGYSDEAINSATVTFSKRGIYTFDSIKVYSVPLKGYEEKALRLKKNSIQNIMMETDTVSGDIEIQGNKILCMAIPYSTGWKGFVDGEETEVLCANDRYLGIIVPDGKHKIRFDYEIPYGGAGAVMTIIGFAVLVFLKIINKKY